MPKNTRRPTRYKCPRCNWLFSAKGSAGGVVPKHHTEYGGIAVLCPGIGKSPRRAQAPRRKAVRP